MVYHVRKNYNKKAVETETASVANVPSVQQAVPEPNIQVTHQPSTEQFRQPENFHVEYINADNKPQNMKFQAPRLQTIEENIETERKYSLNMTTIIIILFVLLLIGGLLWYIFKIRGATQGSSAPSFYYF
jgi:ATP-dependent Zn protease